MKRNDEAFSLIEHFHNDIFLILKESYNFSQSKKETIALKKEKLSISQNGAGLAKEILKKLSSYTGPERIDPASLEHIMEINRTLKSFEMHNNANFLYVFTLFEKYLYDLIKLAFRKNRSFKEKYKQQFVNFAKLRQSKGDSRFIDMLISDKKMIDNIDELQHPHKLLSSILSIEYDNKLVEKYYYTYLEARERRNLLTHRGKNFDLRYVKSVRDAFGKKRQETEKILKDVYADFKPQAKDLIKLEDLIDTRASIDKTYFSYFVFNLLFHASLFLSLIFKEKSSEQIQHGSSYLTNLIHNQLVYSIDYKDPLFGILCMDLFQIIKPEKSSIKKLGFLDQANFILHLEYMFDLEARLGKSRKNNESIAKDLFEKITLNNESFDLHFKILKFYLEKDYKGMLDLLDAEKDTFGEGWKDWFMIKRCAHQPEVHDYLSAQ